MDESAGEWVPVPVGVRIPEGGVVAVKLAGRNLALYRVSGRVFCTDNVCTHATAALSKGWLEGHVIECPLHAGRFDIRTGEALSPPASVSLKTYGVREGSGALSICVT